METFAFEFISLLLAVFFLFFFFQILGDKVASLIPSFGDLIFKYKWLKRFIK